VFGTRRQVSNAQCTAVHVVNTSDGNLVWKRSPVSYEHTWSTQVTDKRAFYTLQASPAVTAVSLESGSVRWSW
jgi:outer membrane protein assembly factor BamB